MSKHDTKTTLVFLPANEEAFWSLLPSPVSLDANIGKNTHFNKMANNKHHQFMKIYKMNVTFILINADFPAILNSTVSKPVSSVLASVPCTTTSKSISNKISALLFKSNHKATNKPFHRTTHFFPGNLFLSIKTILPKHLYLIFLGNIATKLKRHFICKSAMLFETIPVNVTFATVPVCQRVNVVRSAFCHTQFLF